MFLGTPYPHSGYVPVVPIDRHVIGKAADAVEVLDIARVPNAGFMPSKVLMGDSPVVDNETPFLANTFRLSAEKLGVAKLRPSIYIEQRYAIDEKHASCNYLAIMIGEL